MELWTCEKMHPHLGGFSPLTKWVYVMTLRRPDVRTSDRPDVTNSNMDNISDTTNSRVMKPGPRVLCGKTFQTMELVMTLTQGQGHRVTLKYWKIELWLISRTLLTVELWNFTQRYFVTRPLKWCNRWGPRPKVKVTGWPWNVEKLNFGWYLGHY